MFVRLYIVLTSRNHEEALIGPDLVTAKAIFKQTPIQLKNSLAQFLPPKAYCVPEYGWKRHTRQALQ